jgi:hypothetical protein
VQLDFLHGYLPFELGLLTLMFGNLVSSSAIAVVILMPIARECGNSVPPHLLVPRRAATMKTGSPPEAAVPCAAGTAPLGSVNAKGALPPSRSRSAAAVLAGLRKCILTEIGR